MTVRNRMRSCAVLVSGLVLGAAIVVPLTAEAKWQRYNPSICMSEFGLDFDSMITYGGGSFGPINLDPDWQHSLICPIDDSSSYAKTEIASINVHVHDNNAASSNHARACTKNFSGFSNTCGLESKTTASFTGNATLTPEVSDFAANPLDFAYVIVTLGKALPNAWSSLHGYFTST